MTTKKFYAASIAAHRNTGTSVEFRTDATMIEVNRRDGSPCSEACCPPIDYDTETLKEARRIADTRWPAAEGWTHVCAVKELTDDVRHRIAESIRADASAWS